MNYYNNISRETFWGSTAYTPVKNRQYPTYPFGWQTDQEQTEVPLVQGDPYANVKCLKAIMHDRAYDNEQSMDREDFAVLSSDARHEMVRVAVIITVVCFVLLLLFHLYG